jgi:hypothetical protein
MNMFSLTFLKRAGLGACMAAGLLAVGCSAQELEVRQPDGTMHTYRNLQFHPHFNVRPDQITVRDAGATDDGFPVVELVRKDGKGTPVLRVMPPSGDPLYFDVVPAAKPVGTGTKPNVGTDNWTPLVSPFVGFDSLRVEADLSLDRGRLLGRTGDGPWQSMAEGSLASVARTAVASRLLPLQVNNAFGQWRLTADRRFPMVTVRCNGQVVQVRGIE